MLAVSGCAAVPEEIGRPPQLAEISTEPWSKADVEKVSKRDRSQHEIPFTLYRKGAKPLFSNRRAAVEGDVITVKISIDDSASVDTKASRARQSERSMGLDFDYGIETGSGAVAGNGSVDGKVSGNTTTDGRGRTSRAEAIDFKIAATVKDVLPNGNLIISGTQEVRVNYELRVVGGAGIVRPVDISADNTISYEKIAEARIDYGGRGRAMEVQQPAWGQQILDLLSPI